MRKSSFQKNHEEFNAWMYIYGDFLQRLVEARRIVRNRYEKLELVEAFVLRCATRWEVLVLQDIVTSLNRDSSRYASVLGLRLPKHLSYDECKAILYGHRYLDFKSVGEIVSFGHRYLAPSNNPFSAIGRAEKIKINEFLMIRNFLAHYSDLGKRSFVNLMKNTYHYRRAPEPGAFLITINPDQTYRWGSYMLSFLRASESMLKHVLSV